MQVCCVVWFVLVTDRKERESRRLGEESEEAGGGGGEEAELDGESTGGALGVLDVGVVAGRTARAGRLGAGGRCGHGAGCGGTSGHGAVVLREGSGDSSSGGGDGLGGGRRRSSDGSRSSGLDWSDGLADRRCDLRCDAGNGWDGGGLDDRRKSAGHRRQSGGRSFGDVLNSRSD